MPLRRKHPQNIMWRTCCEVCSFSQTHKLAVGWLIVISCHLFWFLQVVDWVTRGLLEEKRRGRMSFLGCVQCSIVTVRLATAIWNLYLKKCFSSMDVVPLCSTVTQSLLCRLLTAFQGNYCYSFVDTHWT